MECNSLYVQRYNMCVLSNSICFVYAFFFFFHKHTQHNALRLLAVRFNCLITTYSIECTAVNHCPSTNPLSNFNCNHSVCWRDASLFYGQHGRLWQEVNCVYTDVLQSDAITVCVLLYQRFPSQIVERFCLYLSIFYGFFVLKFYHTSVELFHVLSSLNSFSCAICIYMVSCYRNL